MDEFSVSQPISEMTPFSGSSPQKLHPAVYILATLVTTGFFVTMICLMYVDIPHANIGAVNQLFGVLAGTFAGVMSFFFGSSLGSKRQGDALVDLVNKKQ